MTHRFSYRSFRYQPDLHVEDDNQKIWHEIQLPGGATTSDLPWSPYHQVTEAEFIAYVDQHWPIYQPSSDFFHTYKDQTVGAKNLFTYNREHKALFADASSLSIHYQIDYQAGNTLTIYNPNTGRHMSFILSRALRDADNTITKWIYNPTKASEAQLYGINHLTIFND